MDQGAVGVCIYTLSINILQFVELEKETFLKRVLRYACVVVERAQVSKRSRAKIKKERPPKKTRKKPKEKKERLGTRKNKHKE